MKLGEILICRPIDRIRLPVLAPGIFDTAYSFGSKLQSPISFPLPGLAIVRLTSRVMVREKSVVISFELDITYSSSSTIISTGLVTI